MDSGFRRNDGPPTVTLAPPPVTPAKAGVQALLSLVHISLNY